MNQSGSDDRLLEDIVRASRVPFDPSAVAAAAERAGDLRALGEAAQDPEAVLLVRMLREDRLRLRRRHWTLSCVGVAAGLLVALVVWAVRDDTGGREADLSLRLATIVESLRSEDAALFGGFVLRAEDDLPVGSGPMRGGGVWRSPRGVLLEAPTAMHWTNPAGATRVRVSLRGPGTTWAEETSGESVEAPALVPGRYVVELQALDGLAGQRIKRSFAVATAQERATYRRARAVIERCAPEDLRDLLEAHYALERGYLEAAAAAARRASQVEGVVGERGEALLQHLGAER